MIGPIFTHVVSHLRLEFTYDIACQTLVELLTLPNLSNFETTICEGLLPALTSGWVLEQFIESIES
jgi:hypothetical protein